MYKFTNQEFEFKNVDIDLRHDAKLLTEEFGINILYVRNCKFVRCRCFDDLHKSGNADCPLCLGTGYFASVQKVKGIESSNGAYSSKNAIKQTNIGVTDQKNEVYFLESKTNPKERDMILKVTWDKQGYPVDVMKVLEIIGVYEMRGDNGRVEVNGCIINNRTDLVKPFSDVITKLPRKAVMELLKGGKYIWPNKLLNN